MAYPTPTRLESPPRGRSRLRRLLAFAASTVALALVAGGWLLGGRTDVLARIADVSAPRPVEPRLVRASADRHRPYASGKGDPQPRGPPLSLIATLEARGDAQGVAAAFLLSGDVSQAALWLDRADDTPDVRADRSALALLAGRPEEALSLAEGVLQGRRRHPQALWNRALALRDLGRTGEAAAAFSDVASLGEPGWAEEARARAAALRRPPPDDPP